MNIPQNASHVDNQLWGHFQNQLNLLCNLWSENLTKKWMKVESILRHRMKKSYFNFVAKKHLLNCPIERWRTRGWSLSVNQSYNHLLEIPAKSDSEGEGFRWGLKFVFAFHLRFHSLVEITWIRDTVGLPFESFELSLCIFLKLIYHFKATFH